MYGVPWRGWPRRRLGTQNNAVFHRGAGGSREEAAIASANTLRKDRASRVHGVRGREIVARFEIGRRRFLDAEGQIVGTLPAFAEEAEELLAMYRALVWTRTFDTRGVALQRAGQSGTYASSLGQEAVAVGAAAAMTGDDVLVPSFREHRAHPGGAFAQRCC